MYAGQTHVLPYVRNYKEAHEFFNKTKKPPRSKKWEEHQRPLKNTAAHHYRIEQVTQDAYDLILYNTVMARFHKPDADGIERRQYIGHHSQTSQGFMWNVLHVDCYRRWTDTHGKEIIGPIYNKAMPSSKFSADYYFDQHDNLITERSAHTRHYKKVSSVDDKLNRQRIRRLFDPLLTMVAMRMPEYMAEANLSYSLSEPFGEAAVSFNGKEAIRKVYEALTTGTQAAPEDYNLFFHAGQSVFDKLASMRAYQAGLLRGWRFEDVSYSDLPEDKLITEKDITQSMWRCIHDALGLGKRNGVEEYQQFPTPDQIVLSNVTLHVPSTHKP